jgi:hypothetical protein
MSMRTTLAPTEPTAGLFAAALWLCVAAVAAAAAPNLMSARYDEETDELVVTLAYRGTNPDHTFSIEWGSCQSAGAVGSSRISARVIGSQEKDPARQSFTKTMRFSLQDLRCRPVTVTLFTAPQFTIHVMIPARGNADRKLRGPSTDAH